MAGNGQQVGMTLSQVGPVSQVNAPNLNVREAFSTRVTRGERRSNDVPSLTNVADGSQMFD